MKNFFVLGHQKNQQMLKDLLRQGNSPEAFLFYGPENNSKLNLAKMFGLSLIKGLEDLATEDCLDPDLKILSLDEESKLHSIAKVKEFIEDVYLPPYQGRKKVFLIDEAHKMLPTASNALLKTLEEPAFSSVIILLAPSLSEVLPTIASRCCKIGFSPLLKSEIIDYLKHTHNLNSQDAEYLAYDSLDSLDYANLLVEVGLSWKETLYDLLQTHQEINYDQKQNKIQEIGNFLENKDVLFTQYFFDFFLKLFRDIALVKEGLNSFVHFKHQLEHLTMLSMKLDGSLEFFTKIIEEMIFNYTSNVKIKTCLEVFFLRINQQHAIS